MLQMFPLQADADHIIHDFYHDLVALGINR